MTKLIKRKFRKDFHPHYINQWLAEWRFTPQKPERQARERDAREVHRWCVARWRRGEKLPS